MDCAELCARLDEELDTGAYADVDASANGLQVGPEGAAVEHVALAVDAAVEPIERAVEAGADCMVVHHGLSWGGIERVTGRNYHRIARLVDAGMPLYASHLPLDGHQELGNAARLADRLDLRDREPFGELGGEYVGQRGRLPEPRSASDLASALESDLDTGGQPVQVLDFGPERLEDLAILTGSGADWLDEAIDVGADALLTGEGKQQVYHDAREAGVTVLLAGHYATETGGLRALGECLREWGLETTFVDCPTGL